MQPLANAIVLMTFSAPTEKRRSKRFELVCPVSIGTVSRGNGHGVHPGELQDIGVQGARIHLTRPVPLGTRLIMHVHFPVSKVRTTKVRFEGTVIRAQQDPPFEIGVQFRRGGKFLRDGEKGSRDSAPAP